MTELRHRGNLTSLLKLAGLARSTYYYYVKTNAAEPTDKALRNRICKIFEQHKGRLGYRRIALVLRHQGKVVNRKKVLRLMRELNLKSLIRVKKYRSYRGETGRIAPNVLNRSFKADKPAAKWATDVSEFKVGDKKLYLSPIIDLFNGEIISYKMSERPNFKLIWEMLTAAITKLKPTQTPILHSDQGWQYQMKQYQHYLQVNNITQSMSRKGNVLDNAIIENFFGTIKSELFYLKKYQSIEELKTDLKNYIRYYNRSRIRLNLNGMSPVKYRAQFQNT
ncbi:transposase InsO family protein [Chitinophaga dinghuensis]|uniref:Transposase InsO family protein n=1 Tax=Chitinophaga dinghuensis TaxID=1539050 RepID=A0A327VRH2_9BACT|nr:IS3 family transposase [Chitinophaga dinghuensis]RAJ72645.1 transposase InsO family protein [Chitinophaga dinghuensis]